MTMRSIYRIVLACLGIGVTITIAVLIFGIRYLNEQVASLRTDLLTVTMVLDNAIVADVDEAFTEYLASLGEQHEFVREWGRFVRFDRGGFTRPEYGYMLIDRIEMNGVAHFERGDIPILIDIGYAKHSSPDSNCLFVKEFKGRTVCIAGFQRDLVPAQNLRRIRFWSGHSDYRRVHAGY